MLSLYPYFFGRAGGVRGCGGAALDRGPCLEGATSRPAAKSLPKGAKSYLKDNAGNRKRLGTVRHGRGGTQPTPPPPPKQAAGGDFSSFSPIDWIFPCVCRRPPPRPPHPLQKACDYAQGRGGHLNCLQHQWKTLFPSGKAGGNTPPGTPSESPGAGWRASKPQTQTLPVPRQCAPEVAGGAGVFLILSASLLDFISKKEGGVRCADEFVCCYFLKEFFFFLSGISTFDSKALDLK